MLFYYYCCINYISEYWSLVVYSPIRHRRRRCVRNSEKRFDRSQELVLVQRQHDSLQTTVPGLDDALAEPSIAVQILSSSQHIVGRFGDKEQGDDDELNGDRRRQQDDGVAHIMDPESGDSVKPFHRVILGPPH